MTDPRVRLSIDSHIATLTLARPEKRNALDAAMIDALHHAAMRIDADPAVRCAILAGEGKLFCTGGDIAAWGGLPPIELWRNWTRAGHRAFAALAGMRVPLITVLAGSAFGGGLELAMTGDLIVAERGVQIGLPETSLGMVPGWSGTQRLVRRLGSRVVKRMVLTGEMLDAADAHALGLIDRLAAAGQGMADAIALADKIAERGPIAVQIAKQLINAAEGEAPGDAMEALAGSLTAYTQDLAEGVAAFKARRGAEFGNS